MTWRRAAAATAAVAVVVTGGCSADARDARSASGAPVAFHPTRPATSPAELARRLTIAERVLHDAHESRGQLDAAGFEIQLRYRQLARQHAWQRSAIGRLPRRYRAEARLQVHARRALRSVLTKLSRVVPAWRVSRPEPLWRLIRFYKSAQRRYGVPWTVLAAVNYVETAFGKIHGLSTAGAQGPMQFMPSTWAAYGHGDVDDPHDAIMGAAHYLAANGASRGPAGVRRALFAYNDAVGYVDGVLAYRAIVVRDPGALLGLYHGQVVYLSAVGDLWLPYGYTRRTTQSARVWAARHPSRHLGTATG